MPRPVCLSVCDFLKLAAKQKSFDISVWLRNFEAEFNDRKTCWDAFNGLPVTPKRVMAIAEGLIRQARKECDSKGIKARAEICLRTIHRVACENLIDVDLGTMLAILSRDGGGDGWNEEQMLTRAYAEGLDRFEVEEMYR